MARTYKQKFNKRFKQPLNQSNSKQKISKLTGVPLGVLRKVYSRGVGAYRTNPASVRPQITSPEQWAMSRVYSFVGKSYEAKKEGRNKINQDQDLFKLSQHGSRKEKTKKRKIRNKVSSRELPKENA
ncbi:MAG TPA: hypothetical protein DCW74_21000 [Alteromonas australica]|uniref:DUF5824 domain-containing protein n=1 Tax=Alteromonas australica TaxID=589873 RepID=A0A350PA86_9ALTE|nr:hypothetical protein [Alteromonas australica]